MVLILLTSHWYRFHPFYPPISPTPRHKCHRVFSWACCTWVRHAGSFDCLMTSLILITMDKGRGHCAWWQSQPSPQRNKQLDLSGTHGLSPGSWQTSLGLGSMSRYSAQILICISQVAWIRSEPLGEGDVLYVIHSHIGSDGSRVTYKNG